MNHNTLNITAKTDRTFQWNSWKRSVNADFRLISAFALPDEEKAAQKLKPLSLTGDSGVLNIGLIDFLLDM